MKTKEEVNIGDKLFIIEENPNVKLDYIIIKVKITRKNNNDVYFRVIENDRYEWAFYKGYLTEKSARKGIIRKIQEYNNRINKECDIKIKEQMDLIK